MPPMRYQNAYLWLVFVSALDVFLTSLVLYVWDGYEVNPIVGAIVSRMGFGWTVAFKFAMCVLVIIICEVVGRRRDRAGRRLAVAAVIINSFPVVFGFALLLAAEPAELPDLELLLGAACGEMSLLHPMLG